MDLPNQELEILRKELKTWEKGFEIEFGRKPTTQDIKQRPSILKKYQQYHKLKKIRTLPTNDRTVPFSVRTLPSVENVVVVESEKEKTIVCSSNSESQSQSKSDFQLKDNLPTLSTDPLFVSYFGTLLQKDDNQTTKFQKLQSSSSNQITISPVQKQLLVLSDTIQPFNDPILKRDFLNEANDEKNPNSQFKDEKVPDISSHPESPLNQSEKTSPAEEPIMPHSFVLSPNKASFQLFSNKSSSEESALKSPNPELSESSLDNDSKEKLTGHKRKFDEIGFHNDNQSENEKPTFSCSLPADEDLQDFSRTIESLLEDNKPKLKRPKRETEMSLKTFKNVTKLKGGQRRNFIALKLKRGFKGRSSFYSSNRRWLSVKSPELMDSSHSTNFHDSVVSEEFTSLISIEESNCLFAVDNNETTCLNMDPTVSDTQRETNLSNITNREYTSEELREILKSKFGFENFREGQETTIKRILRGQSTLFITSTGSGKSLCYQLPTLLLNKVTLVISPLLALMNDQISHLPSFLSGGYLNSQQSSSELQRTIKSLREGKLRLLFVSPEKLCNERFIELLLSLKIRFGFACVDEAHCVSEWSHNFRPSYLRVCDVLRNGLNINCVLALTATATKKTERSICEMLRIPFDGVVRCSSVRQNIKLSVSIAPTDRYSSLIALLQSPQFSSLSSIIIYCMFQKDADNLASFLNLHGFDAASYHAGKTVKERKRVQELFMTNRIRIVVATVAFGMGLNKSDVRAVIHFNMPKSPENYVQEVGRAGRDGKLSRCHLFFDENDYFTIASFSHSDTVDPHTIKNLLLKLFGQNTNKNKNKNLPSASSQYIALPMDQIEGELDMRLAVILTLLIWLEIEGFIKVLSPIFVTCCLSFYKTSPQVLRVKHKLIDQMLHCTKQVKGAFEFSLIKLAEALNSTIHETIQALNSLKNEEEIKYQLKDKAFYLQIVTFPSSEEEIEFLSNKLHSKVLQLESSALAKINALYNILKESCGHFLESDISCGNENELHEKMNAYFMSESLNENDTTLIVSKNSINKMFLRADLRFFISSNVDIFTHGRQVARIFHGISSPCFPAHEWGTCPYWGKYRDIDFNDVMQLANEELTFIKHTHKTLEQQ